MEIGLCQHGPSPIARPVPRRRRGRCGGRGVSLRVRCVAVGYRRGTERYALLRLFSVAWRAETRCRCVYMYVCVLCVCVCGVYVLCVCGVYVWCVLCVAMILLCCIHTPIEIGHTLMGICVACDVSQRAMGYSIGTMASALQIST